MFPHRLAPGTTVGRYQLLHPIGSGAMGVVYEASDPSLGRRVALKVLRLEACDSAQAEKAIARFQREGRAAAQVRHPHVVPIFDFGIEQGLPFLVMELVEGETLAQHLEQKRSLPLPELVQIILPIVSGAAELHAAGIVHRDIKPANILLARGADWDPRLTDFGVSRLEDGSPPLTHSGVMLGTPEYMAPELIRTSSPANEKTDQYSLGVLLYECATGVKPFRGATVYESMHAAVSKTVPPPSSIVPSLPSTFDEVVARAMARDPASRFGSVDELGEALLPFASRRVAARWRTEFGTPSENVPQASLPPTVDTAHERTPLARRALRIAAIAALMGIAAAAVIRFGRPKPAGSPPTPTAVAREEPRPHFEETAPSLPKPEVALAPASEPVPTSPPIASESSAAHVSRKKGANLGGHETARPQPPSKPVPIRTAPEEPAPAASHALPADDNRAPILDVP